MDPPLPLSSSFATTSTSAPSHFTPNRQIWFKHDLRISDHPGLLAAAAAGRPVIPFFCLDPEAYADLALQPSGPRGEQCR